MLVIGITGGIGSGKSTVAKLFAEKGITIIDSDQLARHITEPNQPAYQEIVNKFGNSIIEKNHTLNRAALRKIIFSNPHSKEWLEKLLHPLIRVEMKRHINETTSDYVILMIPLLLETEPNPLINRILVVDAPEAEQIKRTQLRDNATIEEIKAIMQTQIKRAERLASADDVIVNDGSLNDLKSQVNRLHGFYKELSKKTQKKSK